MQIKLWDVRGTKPVQEYKGHYNEHAYLPLHVNETEGLLYAGNMLYHISTPASSFAIQDSHSLSDLCTQLVRIATPGYGA